MKAEDSDNEDEIEVEQVDVNLKRQSNVEKEITAKAETNDKEVDKLYVD